MPQPNQSAFEETDAVIICYVGSAVVRELVETEEEFGRDMIRVVERYMAPVDRPSVPRVVRDNKDLVFSNLKQIAEFHQTYVTRPRSLRSW